MAITKLKGRDGKDYSVDFAKKAGAGTMKDVFWGHQKKYVVAFYRDKLDWNAIDRLETICGKYRDRIFNGIGGDYWKSIYCWPETIVEHDGKTGLIVPVYDKRFFFSHGSQKGDSFGIKGKEKKGKWFSTASHRKGILDPRELGDWKSHLGTCLRISRGVRRLHMAGLAHSDLSYNNVLVDPSHHAGGACIINIVDMLVVPNKFAPDVLGTPDFIAPEVMATQELKLGDKSKHVPDIRTDRHALAVLVYLYLLYRHPLRGKKIHSTDPTKDESAALGDKALFIEHDTDLSNRVDPGEHKPNSMPWQDPSKMPVTVTGPYLTPLFNKAFVQGLHDPNLRPAADEWERAIVLTMDLLRPCENAQCVQKSFVLNNDATPTCPFCGKKDQDKIPVFNLYSKKGSSGSYRPDNHRLAAYDGQSIFRWHSNRTIQPNETLKPNEIKRVAYVQKQRNNELWLVNQGLPSMKSFPAGGSTATPVPVGKHVVLKPDVKILLDGGNGGRLAHVQFV